MGWVNIQVGGSFTSAKTPGGRPLRLVNDFGAMEHGHARAIADAIAWLAEEVLPAAIALDHALHDEGKRPSGPFGQS